MSASGVRVTSFFCQPTNTPVSPSLSDLTASTPNLRRQQAIEGAGRSAAHDVPKRGGAQLKTGPLLVGVEIGEDLGGIFLDAFGNHHDRMGLAALDMRRAAARAISLADTSNSGVEMTSAPPARPAIIAR